MKNYLKYFGIMMLGIAVFFSSCTKEVVGPQGPQGEQGPAGPAGANGQDGQDGQDGNANVQSFTFTAASSDWFSFGTYGDPGYGYGVSFSIPSITSSIATNGTVLAYRVVNGNYIALPYSFPENGYVETYLYGYFVGGVQVERYDTDLYTTPPGSSWSFKFVVIEGNARLANPDLDLNDYHAVAAFYGLKDK